MPVGFQVGIRLTDWVLSGASVDLDFVNNRFFGSSGGSVTSYLSITRASVANAKNSSGVWVQFPTNTLRITDLGLLIEDTRTNNLLQSETPATQTTASLTTGNYTLWVEGSGSALASGGSATITGAASASAGSPNTFNVTVAGTVVVTVTGSLTRFQLEKGIFASSYILTTGTTASRARDLISCTGNLATVLQSLPGSVVADIKMVAVPDHFWHIVGDSNIPTTDFDWLQLNQSDSVVGIWNGSVTLSATLGSSRTFSGGAKIGSSQDATGGRSVVGGGGTVSTSGSGAIATIIPGLGVSTDSLNIPYGYFRRLAVWNNRLADATLQALTS